MVIRGLAGVSSSADIAGAASPAVAEVASSADIAGAACPAVAGVASSADIAGVASSADIAGVVSPDIARAASPAVAGVTSSAVIVEVASSIDLVRDVDSSRMYGLKCESDWVAVNSGVKDCDDMGEVVLSGSWAVTTMIRRECDPSSFRTPGSVAVLPEDDDLPEEEHEAIVVRAIGTGAPWFLTGLVEGTEVEFMIDTGCQVTILATSVFERMCAKDLQFGTRLQPSR